MDFDWKCHPNAENKMSDLLQQAVKANRALAELEQELLQQTSTRLMDWVDHVIVGEGEGIEGYELQYATPLDRIFHHPSAQLPRLVVRDGDTGVIGVAVAVDSIADFLMVRGLSRPLEGSPYASYRRALVTAEKGVGLWVVERRGSQTLEPEVCSEDGLEVMEMWKTRPRGDFNQAIRLAEQAAQKVGLDRAACLILQVEREFWQSRNTAAQIQKNRQDRLGMGWANHDHHTFRSSREHFQSLVRLFEILGFYCRERFYAGQEAGWGAQVMENPQARMVLFLDVDLAPQEVDQDFTHHPLLELPALGTVGLWCALHGDSILEAGMHHLEAQFLFQELTQDLQKQGVEMMQPFSDFPFLKQAFTKGERWRVHYTRIEQLLKEKKITPEQAEKFKREGAIGSHLENLQRREGYKGFNEHNVSSIIKKTDPRTVAF